jgi:putative inorganic carbon (HCO3(-)) transporter
MTSQTRFFFILLILSLPISGIDIHLVHRQVNYAGPGGISISLTFLIAVAISLLWVLGLGFEKGSNVNYFSSTTIPAMLLILAGILSMFNSTDKLLSVSAIFQYCKVFLVYFIAANMVRNNDDLKLVIRVLLISVIFQSLLYLVLSITGLGGSKGDEVLFRPRGALDTPGLMGAYFSSLLLISLGGLFIKNVYKMKVLTHLAFILSVIGLILTFNRASWVDSSACILLGVCYGWWRRWVTTGKILGLLVAITIIAFIFWPMISYRLSENSSDALDERINLMVVAWKIIKAHPIIGIGINNYKDVYRAYIPDELSGMWIRPVHNQYLLVWAETGTIGFTMFVWLLLTTLKKGIHCVRAKDNLLAPLSLGIVLGFLVILLDMYWNIFGSEQVNFYIWFLFGIIAAIDRIVLFHTKSNNTYS